MLASQILAVYKQKARFATFTGEYIKGVPLAQGKDSGVTLDQPPHQEALAITKDAFTQRHLLPPKVQPQHKKHLRSPKLY